MISEQDKNIFEMEISQHQFHYLCARNNFPGYKQFHYGKSSIKKIDLSLFESYVFSNKFDGFLLNGCTSTYTKKLLWIAEYLALKNIYFDIFSALALHENSEMINEKLLTKVATSYVRDVLPEFNTKELLSSAINDLSNCYIEEDESYSSLGENILIKEIKIGGAITRNTNFLKSKRNFLFLSKLFKFLAHKPYGADYLSTYRYEKKREGELHSLLLGKNPKISSASKLTMNDMR